MENRRLTLRRNERLSLKRQIDRLFAEGSSFAAYPLRVVFLREPKADPLSTAATLISVPKKRLKHAVDRNYVRRRIRECYRLNKQPLTDLLSSGAEMMLIAFIYLAAERTTTAVISKAMDKAIRTLCAKLE